MSRKHYIAIAASIAEQRENIIVSGLTVEDHEASMETLFITASNLAGIFAADNSNFDRARFLTACGF